MATKTKQKTQFETITDQFESIVGSIRERIVDTNELVADSVTPYIPNVELGLIDRLPAPSKVVDETFALVNKSVKANHKFVGQIVEAWTPADAGAEADKVVKAATSTAKKAASKTTTKAKSAAKTASKSVK